MCTYEQSQVYTVVMSDRFLHHLSADRREPDNICVVLASNKSCSMEEETLELRTCSSVSGGTGSPRCHPTTSLHFCLDSVRKASPHSAVPARPCDVLVAVRTFVVSHVLILTVSLWWSAIKARVRSWRGSNTRALRIISGGCTRRVVRAGGNLQPFG